MRFKIIESLVGCPLFECCHCFNERSEVRGNESELIPLCVFRHRITRIWRQGVGSFYHPILMVNDIPVGEYCPQRYRSLITIVENNGNNKMYGSMFERGKMSTRYETAYEFLCGIFGYFVFAFVTHTTSKFDGTHHIVVKLF